MIHQFISVVYIYCCKLFYIVMFLFLVRPESSRIFCCKVYKRIGVVPRSVCESVVFTEVRRRSRVLSVGGGRDYSSVTEVTSKVLAEAVLIEV